MKLILKKAIQHGSDEIKELEFREPVSKDLRDLPIEPKQGDFLNLAGILCAQPKSVMDKLGMKDYVEVLGLVATFISGGPETGESA